MRFLFTPSTEVVATVSGQVNRAEIHEELMFFGCSPEFILAQPERGTFMTRLVLSELKRSDELYRAQGYCAAYGKHLVIDTRSHMLMPGMCPAIGGWHCDAYPRHSYHSQPDLHGTRADTPHYVVHVSDQSDGVSRTLYAAEPFEAEVDEGRVWDSVHGQVEESCMARKQYKDGEIVKMLQPTLHRAQRAQTKGWRWWFRMSCFYKPPENCIRKQVQVYYSEGGGW